jgi:hypothetical protein
MDLVPEVAEDAGPAATADQDALAAYQNALAAATAAPENPPGASLPHRPKNDEEESKIL